MQLIFLVAAAVAKVGLPGLQVFVFIALVPNEKKRSIPSVRRWLKRIGFCSGALALLLLLFIAIEHIRGRWDLSHHLSRLKANGEEILVARLEPRRPPVNENASIDLARLFTNRFEAILTNMADAPPGLRFIAPGKAIVSWRLKQWSDDGKTTNDWSKLASQMDEARELLDLIHSAVQKPAYDSGFDYGKGFIDFQIAPLTEVKRVAQLLYAATFYELKTGHQDAANGHLCALVKLAARQHPEPLIICQLVRQACAGLAFAATWQALQAPGWNDSQLAALQSAWEGCDFAGDMDNAMGMERALTYDLFEQLKNSRNKFAFVASKPECADEIFGSVHVLFWHVAWADQDELRALLGWQAVIDRERMARTNSWTALASRAGIREDDVHWNPFQEDHEQMGWYDRLRFLFSCETFSIHDTEIGLTLCAQVQQQMAVTAIAISRYRLQRGMLPADLSALVPKYLPALPRDSMDGKALRYRLQPGAGFVLYSVGEDGKDDGGDPTLRTDKKYYRQIWDGRDAVWPTPATDEEAVAAMKATKY